MNPIWRKAPLVLFRFPGLLASLMVGALLLSLAAAASPLFVSSTTGEILAAEVDRWNVTRYGAGISYKSTNVPFDRRVVSDGDRVLLYERRGELFAERASDARYLGSTTTTILGPAVSITRRGHPMRTRTGRLFASSHALAHVEVLAGEEGPGVWLADVLARGLRVRPGDRVILDRGAGRSVGVAVDGVYRGLYSRPSSGFWQMWSRQIYPICEDCPIPPTFVLADLDQLVTLSKDLGSNAATFAWQAPLRSASPLALDDARALESFAERFGNDMSHRGSELYRIFRCCGQQFARCCYRSETQFSTLMPDVVSEAERRIAAVTGPVELLRTAGLVVALMAVAAAGAFAINARRVEAALLFARGTSAATVGVKGALESFVPCFVGAAAGLALAYWLVRVWGPGGPIAAQASRSAMRAAMLTVPAAVALVGVVSAFSFMRRSEHASARLGFLSRLPWEVALLGAALYFYKRLDEGASFVRDASLQVQRPSLYLLLFPIVMVGGLSTVGARLFKGSTRVLRERSDTFPPSSYLAVHRVAGAPRLTLLLISACALSLGIFVHARTVVRSLEETVDAKAKLFVGSDVQASIEPDVEAPANLSVPVTKVTRSLDAGSFVPGGDRFDLLIVDADTLTSSAYWRPEFGDVSFDELARRLGDARRGRLPVVISGDVDGGEPESLDFADRTISVDVVAHTRVFPGTSSDRPLVAMDSDALRDVYGDAPIRHHNTTTELWVKGDDHEARAALARLEIPPYSTVTAHDVKDIPRVAAVTDTFNVMNVLALGTGLLVIAVMLMYLQARHRSQVVSYALSLRMGLTERGYVRAVAFEVAAMLLSSFAIGVVLAIAATRVILPLLDPLPTIPPGPLLVTPVRLALAVFIVLIAASCGAAWAIERRARATNFAEVMRVGA